MIRKEKLDADPKLNQDLYETVLDYIDNLKADKGYADTEIRNTVLYHLIIGSTLPEGMEMPSFDLPGGEFERFIRSVM